MFYVQIFFICSYFKSNFIWGHFKVKTLLIEQTEEVEPVANVRQLIKDCKIAINCLTPCLCIESDFLSLEVTLLNGIHQKCMLSWTKLVKTNAFHTLIANVLTYKQ